MSLADAMAEVQRRAAARLDLDAQRLRTLMVQKVSQPGQGRSYGGHRASAPGDGPAPDTGRLRQSIGVESPSPLIRRVGTNVKYALYLEFGTRKLAPRPFVRPAVEEFRQRRR